ASRYSGMRLRDLSTLTKPRITFMVGVTAYIGFAIAADGVILSTSHYWVALIATLLGTSLSCMGASTLNQVVERETDALMHRTMDRPIPAGRVSPRAASGLGLALALVGVAILMLLVNPLTAALSAF